MDWSNVRSKIIEILVSIAALIFIIANWEIAIGLVILVFAIVIGLIVLACAIIAAFWAWNSHQFALFYMCGCGFLLFLVYSSRVSKDLD